MHLTNLQTLQQATIVLPQQIPIKNIERKEPAKTTVVTATTTRPTIAEVTPARKHSSPVKLKNDDKIKTKDDKEPKELKEPKEPKEPNQKDDSFVVTPDYIQQSMHFNCF